MQVKHIEKSQGGAGSFRVGKKRKGGGEREKITIERFQRLPEIEQCNNVYIPRL